MAPQLNFDCLNQIFKFMIEKNDNPTSLYSCILVNRNWCQAAIPLLWSDPWKLANGSFSIPQKRNILTKMLLSCLYQESRKILVNENFFQELISAKCIDDIQKRPTFEYSKFLRHLKLNSLAYAIKFWMDFNLPKSQTTHCKIFLEMINYLLKKPPCLFTLNIRYCDGEHYRSLRTLANFLERSEKINNLLELRTFEYDGKSLELQKIFKVLSITSHKIKSMPVYLDAFDDLANLIEVQENLSEITITNNFSFNCWKENKITNLIIERANLITRLTLKYIDFPLSYLSLFKNLQEFYFKNPKNLENFELLSETFLPNLQIFHFEKASLPLDSISKFIQNNSQKLLQIIIKGRSFNKSSLKDLLIIITNYCENLTLYEGPIGSNETNELKDFLKSCKNILSLHFLHSSDLSDDYESFDNLLNEISQVIPKRLETLIISGTWLVTLNSLETFLKSRENLSTISFYWGSLVEHERKFKNLCSKYQKRGIVRDYGNL